MDVILDTNFIIELVKGKTDILDILEYGNILIPYLVMEEIEDIKDNGNLKDRQLAEVALKIINKDKDKINFIELEKKFVDRGIVLYAEKHAEIAVGTIDQELKRQLENKARILTLQARKKLVMY